MSSNIDSVFRSSKSPVGSSARSNFGRVTRARAIATRCCSPPESSPDLCSARSARPTSSSHARAEPRASPAVFLRINSGIATFSAAVKSARSWCLCQTKPTARLRKSSNSFSASAAKEFPAKYTVPLVGVSSAASRCSNVLFPEPEGPISATISPGATARVTPASATTSLSPERNTFRSSSPRTSVCAPFAPDILGCWVSTATAVGLVIAPFPTLFRPLHPPCRSTV